ncbi:MAG: hypothetical protein RB191_02195 [Terriglobia bacterium]|nr:hypothetical protein [Terriglobia bacterium]
MDVQGYISVNSAWGGDPHTMRKPTDKEALKACRLLLVEGFRAFGRPSQVRRKRKFRIARGRTKTWPTTGVFVKGYSVQVWNVNPDECGMGFAEIIHSVSHWVHNAVNPGLTRGRGGVHNGHAHIEQHLVDYVIKRRWVEDGLKVREAKPAPTKDERRNARRLALEARLKWWQGRERRAGTAIKKLTAAIKRMKAKEQT